MSIRIYLPHAYSLAKKVYEKTLKASDAAKELEKFIKISSAYTYIYNFKHLLNGERFTRTLTAESLDYYLENIYKDYGIVGIGNAVTSLEKHIQYYESKGKSTMKKLRKVLNKYVNIKILGQEGINENEQEEIINNYIKKKKSKEEIYNFLKEIETTDDEVITVTNKQFKRNNIAIALIKYYRGYKCQICGISILKKNGEPYIEAAHIKAKHLKGNETLENILLLCPNHHKEFDLGAREILEHNSEKIIFKLNEEIYEIPLDIKKHR